MRFLRLALAALLAILSLSTALASKPQAAAPAAARPPLAGAAIGTLEKARDGDDEDEGDQEEAEPEEGAEPAEEEEAEPALALPLARLPIERIDPRLKARWERGGGVRIYGLPLTEPALMEESGVTVQYFERARFEHHPEHAGSEYEVLLGLLGVELGYAEPAAGGAGEWYFPQTGHAVAPEFRAFWRERGLMALGYPIGESFTDANGRTAQYFERVRLEYHPEHAGTEYVVLLGLLGEEQLAANGGEIDIE